MPIFEYRCSDCDSSFDILHKGAENAELIQCPQCASRNAVKKFSTFAASVGAASSSFDAGCSTGACGMPVNYNSPCSSGMCGLG
jgi:putative FmdB family regulatory protein